MTILFLPSNRNQVQIFKPLLTLLKKEFSILIITQGSFKNEGAEDELKKLNISFKTIDDYKLDPSKILKIENIDVIVVGNDSDVIPQWFVSCGNDMKIPTVLIQDGLWFNVKHKISFQTIINFKKVNPKLFFLSFYLTLFGKYKRIVHGASKFSQIHVWGKASIDFLITNRLDTTNVKIIGYMKSNSLILKPRTNVLSTKNILYAPTSLVEVGLITSSQRNNHISVICDAISQLPHSKLILKPHPNENQKPFQKISSKYNNIELINDNFTDLLHNTSILITNVSTASVEALRLKIPVIVFLPELDNIDSPFPRIFINHNLMLYANDKDSLLSQINRIFSNEYKLNFNKLSVLEYYLGPDDNLAHIRSSDLIKSLMKSI